MKKKKQTQKAQNVVCFAYLTWKLQIYSIKAEGRRKERMSEHISCSRSVDVQLLQLSSLKGMCSVAKV